MLKISVSGVRGLVPETLTPEVCLDFAKAFGTYLDGGKVIVGADPRPSSSSIKEIVFSGLLSTGCQVIDLGICPTPTVGIMIPHLKARGGIVITASHNPLPWNGLKFMREDGIFLNERQNKKLIQIYTAKKFKAAIAAEAIASKGKLKALIYNSSGIDTHIKKVLKVVDYRAIRSKKFKVALDPCNGAGSVACLKLLEKLGCKIEAINCDLTLPFPHPPEPVPENLEDLCQLVKNKKADIGFALDADADRLAIVSEEGKPIGEEMTLALAVKFIIAKHQNGKKKIVVTNLSTTQAINDIVGSYGGTVIRTKIGEVHVAEKLKQVNGLIGGEGNGGVIYPPVGFNRDGLTAIALTLDFLANSGKRISSLVSQIPAYWRLQKKITCQSQEEASEIIEKIKQAIASKKDFKRKNLILTDGVKVVFPTSWVHVRASNTEPAIRIIAEGKDKGEVENLTQEILKAPG